MPVFDYAVVGAGVFGAWLARTLHRRGRRVALIDQYGPANARASSGGESRILRMGYGDREIYTQWSWRALSLYRSFYAAVDPSLLQPTGCLWLCRPEDAATQATLSTLQRNRIPHEVLTSWERFPFLSAPEGAVGIWEPDAAALLARRGVQAVVRQSVREGLTYLQARAPEALPEAGITIYACGPWLPKLFPELLAGRIRATRQEVLYFGTPPADPQWRPPHMPCWIDSTASIYGIPDIEERGFKLAFDVHGPEVDPDTQTRSVSTAFVEAARLYLAQRFPLLANAPLLQAEVCQYENTATGDYLIDRHPDNPRVWLLGGGSGHGYKHGPVIGEYLAAALEDGASIDPIFSLAVKKDYASGQRTSTI